MITASKGATFAFGSNPDTEPKIKICIQGLPAPWSSGNTYLTEDQTKELIETLKAALEKNGSLIF